MPFDWSLVDNDGAETPKTKPAAKPKRRTLWERMHMAAGSVAGGVGDTADFAELANPVTAPIKLLEMITGKGRKTHGRQTYEMTGAPDPESEGEILADLLIRGATGGVLSGPVAAKAALNPVTGLGKNLAVEIAAGTAGGAGSYVGEKVGGPAGGVLGGLAGGAGGGIAAAKGINRMDPITFIMRELEGGGKAVVDSGGLTRHGVSAKGNPGVNIAKLTEGQARKLYQEKYFKPLGLSGADPAFQTVGFDTAINHGVGKAKQLIAEAGGDVNRLLDLRRQEYARLVAANPKKYGRYAKGWENRLTKLTDYVGAGGNRSFNDLEPERQQAALDSLDREPAFEQTPEGQTAINDIFEQADNNEPIDLGENTNRLLQTADDEIAATRADTERLATMNSELDRLKAEGDNEDLYPKRPWFEQDAPEPDMTNVTHMGDFINQKVVDAQQKAVDDLVPQMDDAYWNSRHTLDAIIKGDKPITRGEAEETMQNWADYYLRNWNALPAKHKDMLDDIMKVREEIVHRLGGVVAKPANEGVNKYHSAKLHLPPANDNRKPNFVEDEGGALNLDKAGAFWEKVKAFAKDESGMAQEPEDPIHVSRAGNLNLDKIATTEEIKSIMRDQAYATGRPDPEKWDETDQKALTMLQERTPAEMVGYEPPLMDVPAYVHAMNTLNLSIAKRLFKVSELLDDPKTDSTALQKEFAELVTLQPAVDARRSGGTSVAGRVLNIHNKILHNPLLGFDLSEHLNMPLKDAVQSILRQRNNPEAIAEEASKIVKHMSFWDHAANVLNAPRAAVSMLDLSAPFRQGIFMVSRPQFYSSLVPMVKQAFSKNAFNNIQDEIRLRPSFKLMEQAGLAIVDSGSVLANREEAFSSNLIDKIPWYGELSKGSQRGYVGFLNQLRADTFDSILRSWDKLGIDYENNPKKLRALAKYINSATGRGDFGKANKYMPLLGAGLFSPRLMKSRLDILNPYTYVQKDKDVRVQAWRDLLGFTAIAGTVLTLAKLGGAEVNMTDDSTSSDWLKIKIGDTRIDALGGLQQYMRFASELIHQGRTNSKGEWVEYGSGYADENWVNRGLWFLRTKAAPVPAMAVDAGTGRTIVGDEFKWSDGLRKIVQPMVTADLAEATGTKVEFGDDYIPDAVTIENPKGAVYGPLGAVGFGVQTYKPREKKGGKVESDFDWGDDPTSSFNWDEVS